MTDTTTKFIRLSKDRSLSNTAAIHSLFSQQLYGQAVSLLRQELDTLVRVCYLLTISNIQERHRLINLTLVGKKWKNGRTNITDREMVTVARQYNHWVPEVYDFGNKFTHLSDFHDYKSSDPLVTLDITQKRTIKHYLNSYHQFPDGLPITFENVISYLPKVADKVSRNLSSYLDDLQNRRSH